MKKILFAALAICAISPDVRAASYNGMKFISSTGEQLIVAAENLEMKFKEGFVGFNNSDVRLPLNTLVSMEFCNLENDPASVETICAEEKGEVALFAVDGQLVGHYNSLQDAVNGAGDGIYVVKCADGNVLKVRIIK